MQAAVALVAVLCTATVGVAEPVSALELAGGSPSSYEPGDVTAWVARPRSQGVGWLDANGEPRPIVRKKLRLAVRDVRRAYGELRSVAGRHGGYLTIDTVRIGLPVQERAYVLVRLPFHEFEAALAGIAGLGSVVRLTDQSQDVSEEYHSLRRELQRLSDEEASCLRQLGQETRHNTREWLRYRIMSARAQMREPKERLQQFQEPVQWPRLEVTLTRQSGLRRLVAYARDNAWGICTWVAATNVFWAPVVILALVWPRPKRA